jgi:2-polyprenyl-6-methoxyphenol hydroxylase-like FAD-dependent oxidoreductase
MKFSTRSSRSHDVVVVGSRVAGASTAMLLARRGHRVLLLDRRRPESDTLSTHALMRAGVLQLQRWGLLGRVIDSGAPAIRRTIFHYGEETETVELQSRGGVAELYAPRRYVLDSILVDAAIAASVDVRFGVAVTGLLEDGAGRVSGVLARDAHGNPFEARAGFVVGADGLESLVAREVGARVARQASGATGIIYGYWAGLATDQYEWFYRPGVSAGIIPTNGGEACVWVGAPADRFMANLRWDLERSFELLLDEAAPGLTTKLGHGRRQGRLRGFPGAKGFLRQPWGEGWALVGDASHFKDPISAHGITDALRDAELLADAIDLVICGEATERAALSSYQEIRDRLTLELFSVADEVASFRWDQGRIRVLLMDLSRAMKAEVAALHALDRDRSATAA